MAVKSLRWILAFCLCAGLASVPNRTQAFALLGPYEDWMQSSNNFRVPINFFPVDFNNAPGSPATGTTTVFYDGMPGGIGGPMLFSNAYRWNVPIVTYGFDPSFINFFGTNGVIAVKNAIAVLNDLPGATSIVPTNYPINSEIINFDAAIESLYDLRSVTLSLLLEQLGLASPTRSTFVLKELNPLDVVMRNYDSTLTPSPNVNDFYYSYWVYSGILPAVNEDDNVAVTVLSLADAASPQPSYPAVADNEVDIGQFNTGLTEDDATGLSYLYSTNNVHYEMLLSDVAGVGTDANLLVNGAWRPGIEKITFVPQPCSAASKQFGSSMFSVDQ